MFELLTAISIYCRLTANLEEKRQCEQHFIECSRHVDYTKITFPSELFVYCESGKWKPDLRPSLYIEPREIIVEKPVYKVVEKPQEIVKPVYKSKPVQKTIPKPVYKQPKPEPRKKALPIEVLLDNSYDNN